MSKLAFRAIPAVALFNPIFAHLSLVLSLVDFEGGLILLLAVLFERFLAMELHVFVFPLLLIGGCLNQFPGFFPLLNVS